MASSAGVASKPGTAVTIREVTRTFPGSVRALGGISLDVPPGQFIALLGPSGCGKSTLLRLIAGLDHPTTGSIDVSGREPVRMAFVFQDAHLLPWRNVLDNVALPLELRQVESHERIEAARATLDQVGLSDAIGRYPA